MEEMVHKGRRVTKDHQEQRGKKVLLVPLGSLEALDVTAHLVQLARKVKLEKLELWDPWGRRGTLEKRESEDFEVRCNWNSAVAFSLFVSSL